MPRGFTQANFNVLNKRIEVLSEVTSDFLNSNVVTIGGVQQFVESVRIFRPKALQLHYFKNACPNIPNSLFELFFDVSPASVSIINSSRDPYVGADSDNLNIADAPRSNEQNRIASNMAFCLGFMGISSENNNLPQLRIPRSSDDTEGAFESLKVNILNSFENGFRFGEDSRRYSQATNDFLQTLEDTTVAEEVVEEVVEETPVETSDARDSDDVVIELYQEPILQENAGYETISAIQLPLSLLQFQQVITGSPTPSPSLERHTYNLLAVAEYLVQVGYTSDSVGKFLKKLRNRGFVPRNIDIERRRFGTYLNMTIIRDSPLSGDVSASRFNSNTYKTNILNLLERDGGQATFSDNRFKPVKFTGGANRGGGRLVGAVAIPILRSLNSQTYPDFVSIRANVIDRYATAYQRELGSQSTTDSSPTTTPISIETGSSGYSLIGFQYARTGRLYTRGGNKLRLVTNKITATGLDENVFIFYFIGVFGDEYKLKKLQWGNMADYMVGYSGRSLDFTNSSQVDNFNAYLNTNGRLSTANTLKLTDVQFPVNRFVKSLLNGNDYTPTFSNRITGEINLMQETFGVLLPPALAQIDINLTDASEEITGNTEQSLDDSKLKDIQSKSFTTTFGIEIEGNFDEIDKGEVAEILTSSGFPTESTRYHGSAPDGYFKLESDISVDNDMRTSDLVRDDMRRSSEGAFEMVSPKLTGEQGLDTLSGVLAIIRSQGARTSASAGTHIHFGYDDYGSGESGFQKRKQLLVNYCVLQPFLLATQIAQSRNRGYARQVKVTPTALKKLAESENYRDLRSNWSAMGGARGVVNLTNESSYTMGNQDGRVPTYEFRFPASNFESDTITNMVRFLNKIWIASKQGFVPHSVESSKPKNAEEWLEDMLGQELYSFWKNRYRDLQTVEDYTVDNTTPSRSDLKNEAGDTIVSNKRIPKLNSW